jgi:hypothetical protein
VLLRVPGEAKGERDDIYKWIASGESDLVPTTHVKIKLTLPISYSSLASLGGNQNVMMRHHWRVTIQWMFGLFASFCDQPPKEGTFSPIVFALVRLQGTSCQARRFTGLASTSSGLP